MSTQDNKIKHLEFVQLIVTRMGTNSFLLKGWNVTLSAALFALADRDSNSAFVIIAIVAALSFWGLDAYYLRQEKLFRRLYDDIRKGNDVEPFSMSTRKYQNTVPSWNKTLTAGTIIGFHGVLTLAIICSILFLYCDKLTP